MTTAVFTDSGYQMPKQSVRLVARGNSWLRGEAAYIDSGIPAAGVDNVGRSGGLKGPWGQAIPIFSTESGELTLEAFGTMVIAERDIAEGEAGDWTQEGPVMALLAFSGNQTWRAGTALVTGITTESGEPRLIPVVNPGVRRVKARLATEVVVTDFANYDELVEIEMAGRSGF